MHRGHITYIYFLLSFALAGLIAAISPAAAGGAVGQHVSVESNVAGAGISASGRTYMWYRDGTVTAGTAQHPDDWKTPYSFTTDPQKSPAEIVAMAIGAGDKVFTWYKGGVYSIGKSDDLDYYQGLKPFLLPYKGRSKTKYAPEEIVGIGISAYNTVYAYYIDGMSSKGTYNNLGAVQANIPYEAADNRDPDSIIALAGAKGILPVITSWYRNGYYSLGNPEKLGGKGKPFAQHLTLYSPYSPSFLTGGEPAPSATGDVHVVRNSDGAAHEPVLAPGNKNIAIARGDLQILTKAGQLRMNINPDIMFSKFLAGATDPVLDLNSFSGLGDCQNGYPETLSGEGFCIFDAYDTRAAYDKKGGRFVFLANARNYVWQGEKVIKDAPDGECSRFRIPGGDTDDNGEDEGKLIYSHEYCDKGRRYLLIAVSKSEDPKDGFHRYAIKEENYRDWPLLAVRGDQLMVGHLGDENGEGYAAIVFNLGDMRIGAKRPRYFKLYKGDLGGVENLHFPRRQETDAPLTIAVGGNGRIFGFSRYALYYDKPAIINSANYIPPDDRYTLSHDALRIALSMPFGTTYKLYYGRYPISITQNAITVNPYTAMGAKPQKEINLANINYKTFNCARMAVAGNGAEVIGFAGGYMSSPDAEHLKYDAGYVRRAGDGLAFGAPTAYQPGTSHDTTSSAVSNGLILYYEGICQQQGAAAADPYDADRVWVMHNYGMEEGKLKSALASIDTAQ